MRKLFLLVTLSMCCTSITTKALNPRIIRVGHYCGFMAKPGEIVSTVVDLHSDHIGGMDGFYSIVGNGSEIRGRITGSKMIDRGLWRFTWQNDDKTKGQVDFNFNDDATTFAGLYHVANNKKAKSSWNGRMCED